MKLAFSWRKTNVLLPLFSLLCRQNSSPEAFHGRKQIVLWRHTWWCNRGYIICRYSPWSPLGACLSQAIWVGLQRSGISLSVEVYERGGKSVISGGKKAQKGQQMHFMAVKSRENVLVLSVINSLKTVHLQQLKGGGGYLFCQKWYIKWLVVGSRGGVSRTI